MPSLYEQQGFVKDGEKLSDLKEQEKQQNEGKSYGELRKRYKAAVAEYASPDDDKEKKLDIFDIAQDTSRVVMLQKARFLLRSLTSSDDAYHALEKAEKGDESVNVPRILVSEAYRTFGNSTAVGEIFGVLATQWRQHGFEEAACLLEEKMASTKSVIRKDLPVTDAELMGAHNSCLGDNI